MSDRMKESGIPGLAYGIVIDEEVVLAKGLGLRDVATSAPVDVDTVFRIASMTKSFTALAILKLRDAGKLSLDDPVARYVPEVGTRQLPTSDSGPITIRHLLSHTAGLPEDNPQGDRVLDDARGLSAWLKAGVPFASATGTEFEYSNLGFMILGSVVTRVSGQPFQPISLRKSCCHWHEVHVLELGRSALANAWLLATARQDKDSWTRNRCLRMVPAPLWGLVDLLRDLARYIAMMLSHTPHVMNSSGRPLCGGRCVRCRRVWDCRGSW
jgi:hypothetical protein